MKEEPISPRIAKALEGARPKPRADLEAENARLQTHIKVLDERGMQASLYVRLCYERDALQAKVEEAESHGCQDCAHEAGVPVSGPTGLCPKHADEQIEGRHSERRRRVKAGALAEQRKGKLEWDRWLIAMLVATEYVDHAEGCPRAWGKECECWMAQVFTAAEARVAIEEGEEFEGVVD